MTEQQPILPPWKAEILPTDTPHLQYAVAVTDGHGLQVQKLEAPDREPTPHRVSGTRTVADLDSFLGELDRRELPETTGTLWGNAARGALTAVYNDHTPGQVGGWRDDRLELKLVTDPDWAAWHALSGKFFCQADFGDKVEELLHTVTAPDQAELLEIIDTIRQSSSGEFESTIKRDTGSQTLVYRQENTLKAGRTGELELPKIIGLELRPWEGHPSTYPVDGWFRCRVTDGKLFLAVKLKPTAQIVRTAWNEVTDKVGDFCSRPVYAAP
jgi:hypothetical protein